MKPCQLTLILSTKKFNKRKIKEIIYNLRSKNYPNHLKYIKRNQQSRNKNYKPEMQKYILSLKKTNSLKLNYKILLIDLSYLKKN